MATLTRHLVALDLLSSPLMRKSIFCSGYQLPYLVVISSLLIVEDALLHIRTFALESATIIIYILSFPFPFVYSSEKAPFYAQKHCIVKANDVYTTPHRMTAISTQKCII